MGQRRVHLEYLFCNIILYSGNYTLVLIYFNNGNATARENREYIWALIGLFVKL